MHKVFIGSDESGEFPWLAHGDEPLPAGKVRWRLVAQTDDEEEAARVMTLVSWRCFQVKKSGTS